MLHKVKPELTLYIAEEALKNKFVGESLKPQEMIEKIFDNGENSLHKKIISAKIESPNEKIKVLSERCNVDKSIISRHLKIFLDDVKKFLE